jgi:glycosyltransferase involved in cell wall biosynthesis
MKRVLMIIPFFPPMAGGGVYRPLAFVKYLQSFGWRPTVIAPRGDSFWIRDEGLCEQIPEAVRVIRTDTLSGQSLLARARRGGGTTPQRRSSRLFAAARRVSAAMVLPDTYRGWRPYALAAARGILGRETFDVLYSTSPPETSHLVAGRIHDEHGLPWVADFRDPWMNLHLLRPPTPLHAGLHRRMEARVCRAAHVVVTTRWHEALVRERYPGAPSVTRIANGYDAADAESVAGVTPEGSPMRITHAGMLTQKRSAIPFLRGLRAFFEARPEARGDVDVRFLGAREDANERAVRALELDDVVRFADTVSHRETLQMEKSSHILLLIKHVNPDYRGLVPGKLYEYIGLCRPILALAPPGEARDIVEGLRRGEVVDQESTAEVARAIARLYDAYREGALESRYDLAPRPELTRERLAGELAALFERIASEGKKSS